METATQTATENIIDGEITDLEVIKQNRQISIRHELTPEEFRLHIARQKEMRQIMLDYVRDEMKDGIHYDSELGGKKLEKKALKQDGAFKICALFNCTIGEIALEIIREDGGHFTVVAKAPIFNEAGIQKSIGDGCCTTREDKYAYRWENERNVPSDLDKSTLKTRGGKNKDGSTWLQYQIPNTSLADLENTVLKMACKRATVAATRKLPLVSEIFIAADDPSGESAHQSKPQQTTSRKPATQAKPSAESAPQQTGKVKTAVDLAKRLVNDFECELDDLSMQFLPEGVAKFSELTEAQAVESIPGMVQLLNSKIEARKEAEQSE